MHASWWINATTRGGARPYVDLPSTAAADKYVAYLVSHGVSKEGDEYGVGLQTITSGMAGIAVPGLYSSCLPIRPDLTAGLASPY